LPSEADRRRAREIIHRVLEGAQLDPRFLETLTRLANRLQSPAVKAAA